MGRYEEFKAQWQARRRGTRSTSRRPGALRKGNATVAPSPLGAFTVTQVTLPRSFTLVQAISAAKLVSPISRPGVKAAIAAGQADDPDEVAAFLKLATDVAHRNAQLIVPPWLVPAEKLIDTLLALAVVSGDERFEDAVMALFEGRQMDIRTRRWKRGNDHRMTVRYRDALTEAIAKIRDSRGASERLAVAEFVATHTVPAASFEAACRRAHRWLRRRPRK